MKALLASIVLAVFATAAVAAERPPVNWSGCYVGASAGGVWSDSTFRTGFIGIGGLGIDANPSGFAGGGQIGCDYQWASSWLAGIQADFSFADASDRKTVFPALSIETGDFKIKWFASLTGRLGYAFGPWLVYGRGGVAWSKTELHDSGIAFIAPFDFRGDSNRTGWTLGAGLEYAFAPNWSARVEYDYFDFGEDIVHMSGTVFGGPASTNSEFRQAFSVVKIGLNYHFWAGHI